MQHCNIPQIEKKIIEIKKMQIKSYSSFLFAAFWFEFHK